VLATLSVTHDGRYEGRGAISFLWRQSCDPPFGSRFAWHFCFSDTWVKTQLLDVFAA
jgi:hypothetical protein